MEYSPGKEIERMAVAGNAELASEYEELRRTVEEFARAEIAPVIGGYYEREEFPYPLVARMGELGLFGIPFPEAYGGQGGDFFALCLVLEELARIDSSVAITLEAAVGLGAMPIFRYGSEAQRERWLPDLCAGRALAAFGLSEPGAGSDAAAVQTSARLEGAEWVLNGTKVFITNSGTELTSLAIVVAATGARPDGRSEISAIIVPAGTPGFSAGRKYSKVGWSASDTRELTLVDCRVAGANLLGGRGDGYRQALETLDAGRVAIAALGVGLAQGCIDECLRYVGERRAFGHRIGEYQAIQFKLADMETRTHAARLSYYHAAARLLAGEPFKKEAAMAKLVSSDAAMVNAREATQVFGGYGYMNETPVGRFYRDAKILEIGEGTSEVQRLLIARELGLPTQATA
jgi:alkylation response protein AidB-like acyl-CoA dehydrogenase